MDFLPAGRVQSDTAIECLRSIMKFSIIIPTYNEEKYIKKCLDSIKNQGFKDHEIIVVDAESTDKTIAIAEKYTTNIILSDKKSVSYQRNLGANCSKGDYFIFLDADTQLYNALSFAVKYEADTNKLKAVSTLTNFYFGMKSCLNRASLIGYNIVVEKSFFYKVGGFRTVLLEDIDFSERALKHGKTKYVTSRCIVTSDRRYTKMGVLRTLRYYWELFIYKQLQNKKHFRFIKYINIR